MLNFVLKNEKEKRLTIEVAVIPASPPHMKFFQKSPPIVKTSIF